MGPDVSLMKKKRLVAACVHGEWRGIAGRRPTLNGLGRLMSVPWDQDGPSDDLPRVLYVAGPGECRPKNDEDFECRLETCCPMYAKRSLVPNENAGRDSFFPPPPDTNLARGGGTMRREPCTPEQCTRRSTRDAARICTAGRLHFNLELRWKQKLRAPPPSDGALAGIHVVGARTGRGRLLPGPRLAARHALRGRRPALLRHPRPHPPSRGKRTRPAEARWGCGGRRRVARGRSAVRPDCRGAVVDALHGRVGEWRVLALVPLLSENLHRGILKREPLKIQSG